MLLAPDGKRCGLIKPAPRRLPAGDWNLDIQAFRLTATAFCVWHVSLGTVS